jgi:hypothetical protein
MGITTLGERVEATTREGKLAAAVTRYTAVRCGKVEVYDDDVVAGTLAIRAHLGSKTRMDFLLVGYSGQNTEWIADNLEEVQFKHWPPRAGRGQRQNNRF